MQSRSILAAITVSASIVMLSAIDINLHSMPFKVTYDSLAEPVQKQVTCLADNIYFEAAHEPLDGKKAVAFVTINRVLTGNYASSICEVVEQKRGHTCQFSWFCDKRFTDRRLSIKDTPLYNDIRELAVNMYVNFEKYVDVTSGATYYHADYVNPRWKLERVDQIGHHIFYRSAKDEINRSRNIYSE